MPVIISDNKVHQATINNAETTRQTAVSAAIAAGGNVAGAIKTAEIAYYRSVIASCVTNNLPFSNFTQALINLGTGGA
jgi:hypothetical protein